jgi:hypothetical protein
MNAVQQLDQFQGFDYQSSLFPHLAHHGSQERFAQLDQATRQRPMPLQRLGSAPDKKHPALVYHHRAHTHQRR